jgi:hypothetical protein
MSVPVPAGGKFSKIFVIVVSPRAYAGLYGTIQGARRTEKGAMNMTERYLPARSADPSQQDVDDLIFLGQTGPQVSQR